MAESMEALYFRGSTLKVPMERRKRSGSPRGCIVLPWKFHGSPHGTLMEALCSHESLLDVPLEQYGSPMKTLCFFCMSPWKFPWKRHRSPHRRPHGSTMEFSPYWSTRKNDRSPMDAQCFHGASMVLPWCFHGYSHREDVHGGASVRLPWDFH